LCRVGEQQFSHHVVCDDRPPAGVPAFARSGLVFQHPSQGRAEGAVADGRGIGADVFGVEMVEDIPGDVDIVFHRSRQVTAKQQRVNSCELAVFPDDGVLEEDDLRLLDSEVGHINKNSQIIQKGGWGVWASIVATFSAAV